MGAIDHPRDTGAAIRQLDRQMQALPLRAGRCESPAPPDDTFKSALKRLTDQQEALTRLFQAGAQEHDRLRRVIARFDKRLSKPAYRVPALVLNVEDLHSEATG